MRLMRDKTNYNMNLSLGEIGEIGIHYFTRKNERWFNLNFQND